MKHVLARLRRDRRGAISLEYGLIGGFMALAIWGALAGLGYVLTPEDDRDCGVDASLRASKPEQA